MRSRRDLVKLEPFPSTRAPPPPVYSLSSSLHPLHFSCSYHCVFPINMSLLQYCYSLFLLLLSFCQVTASSSSSVTSVTALDRYGNSIQLQNARQAAIRHGRLVVAAKFHNHDVVVVVSIYTPQPGKVISTKGVLSKICSSGYVACTGVKADATYLVEHLREYCKQVWNRFDISDIPQDRMTQALSKTILLEFMGYNRAAEFCDGIVQKSDEDEVSWARPLGIQTLVIGPSSPIALVEPSGVVQQRADYVAMGKDSDAVMRALQERFPTEKDATLEEFKDLLIDAIQQTVEGQKQSTELIVEVVSEDGIEVSSMPLRVKT